MEYSTSYFDLTSFPDGETKWALERVAEKCVGKAVGRVDAGNSKNGNGNDVKKLKKIYSGLRKESMMGVFGDE